MECTDRCLNGQTRYLYSSQGRSVLSLMTFIMYARFHEVGEAVITTTNSPAVVLSTTGFAVMRRATVKIELEVETAKRECGGKEERVGTYQRPWN